MATQDSNLTTDVQELRSLRSEAAYQIEALMDLLIAAREVDDVAVRAVAIRARDLAGAMMWIAGGDKKSDVCFDVTEARQVITAGGGARHD